MILSFGTASRNGFLFVYTLAMHFVLCPMLVLCNLACYYLHFWCTAVIYSTHLLCKVLPQKWQVSKYLIRVKLKYFRFLGSTVIVFPVIFAKLFCLSTYFWCKKQVTHERKFLGKYILLFTWKCVTEIFQGKLKHKLMVIAVTIIYSK